MQKMKELLRGITISLALVFLLSSAKGQAVPDSIEMGNSYANDVFYSFENGTVLVTPRVTWDIAFHTPIFSATILTNGAGGVDLYTYPLADTSGWNTLDTTGLSGWNILYNSDTLWEDGAFNRNAAGHPDYGWGRYNPINHDVVGDSLYVIKCIDGQYRKLWIQRKHSIGNTYYIRYANLDGSDEHNATLDVNPYTNKNFVYFTFPGEDLIDREPDTASWDVLFTQYQAMYPTGDIVKVTGVLNNFGVYANRFHPVPMDFTDWLSQPMDSTRSPIGYDWKKLNFQTFTYEMEDSLIFFVQTRGDDIYKLYFTAFYSGMAGGKAVFTKELLSPSSVTEVLPAEEALTLGPNPVRDQLSIIFKEDVDENISYMMFDLSGREILSGERRVNGNRLELAIPAGSAVDGMHVLVIYAGNKAYTSKIIVNNN